MTKYGLPLAFALAWPTCMAYLYFVVLAAPAEAGGPQHHILQATYGAGKAVQFLWPVLCVAWWERRWTWPRSFSWRGLQVGIAFGLGVSAGMFALYFGLLRGSSLLLATPTQVRQKLTQFGLQEPGQFLLFAFFLAGIHSLLEEYYWRWFVFGWLARLWAFGPALVLSSLGFMAHHVVVLAVYLPGQFLTAVVPFSLCIALGGAAWAWLYDRTGSIWTPWVSHLLIDVAIMMIGYDLAFGW
jgi:membrane protease YdiL (CAAX protease family)